MPHSPAVEELLRRKWHAAPGAREDELKSLEDILPFELPNDYRALLLASNGGEGPLAATPLSLCLYEIEFAKQLWTDPFYRALFGKYYFFGSDGGGESIAMAIGSGKAGNIVSIDCIAGEDSKETIAQNFAEFLTKVGRDTASDA